MNYVFSPKEKMFYPLVLKDRYVESGTWPGDEIPVDDSVFYEFASTPEPGKGVGVSKHGVPEWIDLPAVEKTSTPEKRLYEAQGLYSKASNEITKIQQQIDDEDYNGEKERLSIVKVKSNWINYRKALRAYLETDGADDLPENLTG